MIHADKKSAGKWKDMPIPFPSQVVENGGKVAVDISGISQIPTALRGAVYREK